MLGRRVKDAPRLSPTPLFRPSGIPIRAPWPTLPLQHARRTPPGGTQRRSWQPRSARGSRRTADATPRWNGAGIPYLTYFPQPRAAWETQELLAGTHRPPKPHRGGTVCAHPNHPRRSLTHFLQRPQAGPPGAAVLGCGRGWEHKWRCDLGRHRGLLAPAAAAPPAAAQHGSEELGSLRGDRAAGRPLRPGPGPAHGPERRNLAAPGGSREKEVSGGGRDEVKGRRDRE